jgi:hypothetical protein
VRVELQDPDLLVTGYTDPDLLVTGYTDLELIQTGYPYQDLIQTGYSDPDLIETGYQGCCLRGALLGCSHSGMIGLMCSGGMETERS